MAAKMNDTSSSRKADSILEDRHKDVGGTTGAGVLEQTMSRVSARRSAGEKPSALKHLSDEEIERLEVKLKRKIDTRMLPMIILVYIMNYLDRNNIPGMFDFYLTGICSE